MKITRLHLERFLGYAHLSLDLSERISIFVGENGAGKSSILDAIRAAITGTVAGVARGAASSLQHHGKGKPWGVELDLAVGESLYTIRRTATTLSHVEDGRNIKLDQTSLDHMVGDRAALAALLDVGHAYRMTPAQRQDLVFRLSGLAVTEEVLEERGLKHPAIRLPALSGNWKKASTEAGDRKRAAAREQQDLHVVEPEDRALELRNPTLLSAVSDDILRQMRGRVADLESKERELEREIGRLEGRSEASLEALAEKASELQAAVDALAERDIPQEHTRAIAAVKKAKEEGVAAARALEKERERLRDAGDAIEGVEADIRQIQSATSKHACPICGLEHEGEPQTGAVDALEPTLTELRELVETISERINAGEADLVQRRSDLAVMKDRAIALKAEEDQAVALLRELKQVEAQIEETAAPPVEAKIAGHRAKLEQTRKGLERGRSIVREVDQYRQDVMAHQNALQRHEKLGQEAEAYRAMEHLCRPEGLRSELLAPVIGPIRDRLASWAPLLDGLEVHLTDDFEVEVTRDGHPMRLSGSETWRVSLVLADALAHLSGLGWLCLDEMSLLDGPHRAAVTRMLARLEDSYEQVLVCSVLGDVEPKQCPPASGVRIYRVTGGQVSPVPGETAA